MRGRGWTPHAGLDCKTAERDRVASLDLVREADEVIVDLLDTLERGDEHQMAERMTRARLWRTADTAHAAQAVASRLLAYENASGHELLIVYRTHLWIGRRLLIQWWPTKGSGRGVALFGHALGLQRR